VHHAADTKGIEHWQTLVLVAEFTLSGLPRQISARALSETTSVVPAAVACTWCALVLRLLREVAAMVPFSCQFIQSW